jgi:protein involved in temperature-dependent protein secretion
MLHASLRSMLRRPILAQLRPVAAGRRRCVCTAALRHTWTAGSSSLSFLLQPQPRWMSSGTTVEDVKQMQADVASLVAQRHWDDAFDAAVECSRAIKDLTGYPHGAPRCNCARGSYACQRS